MAVERVTVAEIAAASRRLRGVVTETPLQRNDRLSERSGADVWLKREDLQPVRSYKIRGAYNLISQLTEAERMAGVICASAGNHGQGVAYACARLGINGSIYLPATTPRQKRDRMRRLGGEFIRLVITGDTYDEAAQAAYAQAWESGATMVPAFDDPRTIAGQGTLAPEIVDQLGHAPHVLIVPVGGGGMVAGCLVWFAKHHPKTRIIAAEPSGAACLAAGIAAGEPVNLEQIDTFVDGAAVRRAGDLPVAIALAHPPELITVPEGQICTEMLELYQTDGIIAEPAGALAPAAVGVQIRATPGMSIVAIVSGGNNDVSRYHEVVERSLVHEGRKHYFLVNFPQEPGALRRFLDEVLGPDDDITHFEYVKRSNRDLGPALVGIELGHPEDITPLRERMDRSAMTVDPVEPDSPFYQFLI